MSSPFIERFMATTEKYLRGADEPDSNTIPHAARLLVREFAAAVEVGPEALLSAPDTMRSSQITLAQAVDRLLDDEPTLVCDLLVEIREGTRADVIEFLANTYAAWVIRSYHLEAFK